MLTIAPSRRLQPARRFGLCATNRLSVDPAESRSLNVAHNRFARRGSVYIIVLGSAMAVTVMGLSALTVVRITRRSAQETAGLAQARLHARTAIELGLHQIASIPDWRNTFPNGTWLQDQPIGTGTYSLEGVDPNDADLADSVDDPLVLTGTGMEGDARYKLSVQLVPSGPPGMDFLASAVHTSSWLDVTANVTADAPISSNGTINIGTAGGVINADVETVSGVTGGGTLNGTSTTGIDPKETPTIDVFDFYIASAIPIPLASLPIQSGYYELSGALVSPNSHPTGGPTHIDGLYSINCAGADLRIKDTRVHGSLVILEPGPNSEIAGSINWEPFNTGLPALLVRGSIRFSWSGSLIEGGSINVNFNPTGSPYAGATDDLMDDTYPGIMKGLIGVSGILHTVAAETVEGVILGAGSELRFDQSMTVTHDPTLINAPPPGFERAVRPLGIVSGSWKRNVD